MDHQIRAGASMGAVIGIRKPEIKGEVVGAIGIERAPTDLIKTFRALAVSLLELGPQRAGKGADRVVLIRVKRPAFSIQSSNSRSALKMRIKTGFPLVTPLPVSSSSICGVFSTRSVEASCG